METSVFSLGLEQILHFEAIARNRSLKLAADELHLSQPAVTQSLKALESKIGVPLCLRSRATFQLTEAGQRLLKSAQVIRSELETYQSESVSDVDFNGTLSIGVIDNFQSQTMEKALSETANRLPRLKIDLQVYPANEIQRLLMEGEIDFGFGIFNSKRDQLNYRQIGSETIHHYISEKHPLFKSRAISIENLDGHNRIWVDIVSRSRHKIESDIFLSQRQKGFLFSGYTNNLNTAILLLRSGRNVVPLPAEYLQSRRLDFKYRPLDRAIPPYVLKQELAYLRDRVRGSRAAKMFLELIAK